MDTTFLSKFLLQFLENGKISTSNQPIELCKWWYHFLACAITSMYSTFQSVSKIAFLSLKQSFQLLFSNMENEKFGRDSIQMLIIWL